MQFKNVVIQSLTAVDAPVKMTSAEIGERLQPAMERLGIRPGLMEEISGINSRRFWNNGTQPSDAATMAAEEAIKEAGIDRAGQDRTGQGRAGQDRSWSQEPK